MRWLIGWCVLVSLWRVMFVCTACLVRLPGLYWIFTVSLLCLVDVVLMWWVLGGWVGLVVCVTSCEGHVVDALASRADEVRRSLR